MTTTAADTGQKELPAGWKWVKLGKVCEILSGYAWRSSLFTNESIGLPIIRIQNLGNKRDDFVYWAGEYDKRYLIEKGDLLLSLSGSFKTEIWSRQSALLNQRIVKLYPRKMVSVDWLLSCIEQGLKAIASMGKHAIISNVSLKDLRDLSIPLPPLEEQKRIAAKLNEQMAAVEKAKKAAEERLEAVKALPAAYLRDALPTGEVAQKKGWLDVPIGKFLELKHGYAFKSRYFGDNGTHVVLTPGNFFEAGGFKEDTQKEKRYVGEIPKDFVLNEGDIIVAMTQQAPGLIGSSAIIPTSDLYLHNQRLGKVVNLDQTLVQPRFLYHLFNVGYVRQELEKTSTGSMVQHTSPNRIYAVKVSIPPIDKQREIVSLLKEKFSAASLAEQSIQQELDTIEAMPASLLRKAFSGEL